MGSIKFSGSSSGSVKLKKSQNWSSSNKIQMISAGGGGGGGPAVPTLRWKLDEASGSFAEMYGGPSLEAFGNVTYHYEVSPIGQQAIHLNSTSDYIAAMNVSAGKFPSFTWHWWRKSNGWPSYWGANMGNGSGAIVYCEQSPSVGTYPGLVANTSGSPSWVSMGFDGMGYAEVDDAWHHYSLRFDDSTKQFKVTLDGTTIWTSDVQTSGVNYGEGTLNISIGGPGSFSNLVMVSAVLSDAEVAAAMLSGG